MQKFLKMAAAALTATMMLGLNAGAVEVLVDGTPLRSDVEARAVEGTTYVSLRSLTEQLRGGAEILWDGQATVRDEGLELRAMPGEEYIQVNGRQVAVEHGVRMENGRVLLPVRILGQALGAAVEWDGAAGRVLVKSDGAAGYTEEELYWLSRIISAESQGESLEGKIAVGNVVLNRVKSEEFPDSIYEVIFDARWGGQFEPVRNGTIYNEPTAESVEAAKLCLAGENTAGESLYFLAPALTGNHWTMENREYVTTIGSHWFYR